MDGSIEPEALTLDRILLIGSDAVRTSKGCEMEVDIWDRAFYDDGEWVSWSDVEEQLRYQDGEQNIPMR